jgi:hypothetical protein
MHIGGYIPALAGTVQIRVASMATTNRSGSLRVLKEIERQPIPLAREILV